MATTGNITTAPNGQQAVTENAASTYTGDELTFIAQDEQYHPGITAEQAESDLRTTEAQGDPSESASQKLQDAEKRWADAFNQMIANTFTHRPNDLGLNAEPASSTSSTGGSTGA